MKKLFLFAAIILFISQLSAQDFVLTKEFKASTIERLCKLMNERYVFPEVAEATSQHLQEKQKSGAFDEITKLEDFAEELTKEVQSINKDKHMRIRPSNGMMRMGPSNEDFFENLIKMKVRDRENSAGFREVKKLDGNVGYLDLRGFAGPEDGIPVADHYMALLSNSDAIIIDLRKNGGGNPDMVRYICSYFFDEHIHLNSLYWREGDRTDEFWTLDKVGGKKMPDVPLFLLTSDYTFSAAEEFSYNLQTRKRAKIVGETTGGGANPGGFFPLNDQLGVFIPTGKAINPVTGTNWEGTGVEPEVKVSKEDALDEVVRLATTAAEDFRKAKTKLYESLIGELENHIKSFPVIGSESEISEKKQFIFKSIELCMKEGLLNEEDINYMGYQFLQKDGGQVAESIFYSNVLLFPESANVYDSYGEALAKNGKLNEAVKQYEMAVSLAERSGDRNVEMFRENLENIKEKLEKR